MNVCDKLKSECKFGFTKLRSSIVIDSFVLWILTSSFTRSRWSSLLPCKNSIQVIVSVNHRMLTRTSQAFSAVPNNLLNDFDWNRLEWLFHENIGLLYLKEGRLEIVGYAGDCLLDLIRDLSFLCFRYFKVWVVISIDGLIINWWAAVTP